jgi:hypothetical protein
VNNQELIHVYPVHYETKCGPEIHQIPTLVSGHTNLNRDLAPMFVPKRPKKDISFRVSRLDTGTSHVSRSVHFHRQNNGRVGARARHVQPPQEPVVEPEVEPDDTIDSLPQPLEDFISFDPEPAEAPIDESAMSDDDDADSDSVFFFCSFGSGSGAYRWLPVQIRAVADWIPHRETYLDELLRHDGRGSNAALICSHVGCGGDGIYKCRECMFDKLFCSDCIVRHHSNLPLHRILVSAACFSSSHFSHASFRNGRGPFSMTCPYTTSDWSSSLDTTATRVNLQGLLFADFPSSTTRVYISLT